MSQGSRAQDGSGEGPLLAGEDDERNYGSTHHARYDKHVTTYQRRWWNLFLFSLLGFLQCLIWNTWGPISDSALVAFGWSKPAVAMLPNFGNIMFVLAAFPMSWVMDTKGLRVATVLSSGMIFVGTALRCVSSEGTVLMWTAYIAAMFNGAAGPVPFAGPSLFSSTWFPSNQRATSTGVLTMAVSFGLASAFFIGPSIVHSRIVDNTTMYNISLEVMDGNSSGTSDIVGQEQREEIMVLMYIECGLAALLFLLVLLYFPAKPPSPPSLSASTGRMKFSKGLLQLCRMREFWLVNLAYAIPSGTFGAWASVLIFTLAPLGVDQVQAGWMGFFGILLGSLAGLVMARFSDMFSRHLKLFIVVDFLVCAVVMLWVSLMTQRLIPAPTVCLYISTVLVAVTALVPIPLFFEMASEICYPVAEGITVIFMAASNNATGIIYFLILQIPGIGYSWMTWFLMGTAIFAIPILLALKVTYSRLTIDSLQEDTDQRPCDSEMAPDEYKQKKSPS